MSLVASTPFTVHDLEGMPDDGRRYELVDGELLVSPAPGLRHQTISYRLHRVLDDTCPDDLYVAYERMGTPCCWVLDPDVPDLLVLELDADGRYAEVARVAGAEVFDARRPFGVRVVPGELLGRLRPR